MRSTVLSLVLLLVSPAAELRSAEDVNAIVKTLFPKNEQMLKYHYQAVADSLGLHAGGFVADVGCGQGELALVWSRVVGPAGHVWAEDINRGAVKASRRLMKSHHARNVTVLLGEAANPHLPPGKLDGISLTFVYHELEKYPEMLARFHEALKPDGRLVILDPLPRKTATRPRASQVKNHVLTPDLAQDDLKKAGFEVLSREDHFVDDPDMEGTMWLIVARPAPKP